MNALANLQPINPRAQQQTTQNILSNLLKGGRSTQSPQLMQPWRGTGPGVINGLVVEEKKKKDLQRNFSLALNDILELKKTTGENVPPNEIMSIMLKRNIPATVSQDFTAKMLKMEKAYSKPPEPPKTREFFNKESNVYERERWNPTIGWEKTGQISKPGPKEDKPKTTDLKYWTKEGIPKTLRGVEDVSDAETKLKEQGFLLYDPIAFDKKGLELKAARKAFNTPELTRTEALKAIKDAGKEIVKIKTTGGMDEASFIIMETLDPERAKAIKESGDIKEAVRLIKDYQNHIRTTFLGGKRPPTGEQGDKDFDSIPIREPHPKELDYFRKNPNVTGMATEDNAVILNPYSNLSPSQKESVITNEKARIFIRKNGLTPDFQLTDKQKEIFKDYGSDKDIKETIAARILTSDPSAGDVTPEQKLWVKSTFNFAIGKPTDKKPGLKRHPIYKTKDDDWRNYR